MKLLVIVLCLLSERYLVHVIAHHRFNWFMIYSQTVTRLLSKSSFLSSPWILLFLAVFPMLMAAFLVFHFFSNGLFGFVGLMLNILVLYSCLGPTNPFYPLSSEATDNADEKNIGAYLADCNAQIFAPLFWYIFLGPMAALAYRLVSVSQEQKVTRSSATRLTQIFDWLPARMTALLYMLVGNFQLGLAQYARLFLSKPEENETFIAQCGLSAMDAKRGGSEASMIQAERFVEHAIIALMVLLACFTLFAWM